MPGKGPEWNKKPLAASRQADSKPPPKEEDRKSTYPAHRHWQMSMRRSILCPQVQRKLWSTAATSPGTRLESTVLDLTAGSVMEHSPPPLWIWVTLCPSKGVTARRKRHHRGACRTRGSDFRQRLLVSPVAEIRCDCTA